MVAICKIYNLDKSTSIWVFLKQIMLVGKCRLIYRNMYIYYVNVKLWQFFIIIIKTLIENVPCCSMIELSRKNFYIATLQEKKETNQK